MFICRCCGNDGICAFNKGRARVVARNILAAFQLLTCQRESRETRVPQPNRSRVGEFSEATNDVNPFGRVRLGKSS
jgi:hypothetical protein